ncbi:hypothetical protein [Olleya sp. Bg11-27]|uniref:hypothetical protein n=1 Tax=Olleya sp. Bg11-27 TaxID=2058135 RepID=UPI000C317060|nr:hypothetical protein [Olleya sp. Bg11-27]AUC76073.1 hypothetical protein CW732_10530 [Olleya sp. Bg11-27]
MKPIITLLIILSSFCCYSTIQHKDILCYNGETYGLKDYYFENYFEKHPEKKPKTEISSSALWRGYVATFTVYGNQIYLTDLQIQVQDKSSNEMFATKWKSVYKDFSPNSDRYLIKWINDLILLPIGEPIDYEDGYGITHNQYELIEIKKGIIVANFDFSLKEYKKKFKNRNPYFLDEKELLTLKKELKK